MDWTKLTNRGGDDGTSSTLFGTRLPKSHMIFSTLSALERADAASAQVSVACRNVDMTAYDNTDQRASFARERTLLWMDRYSKEMQKIMGHVAAYDRACEYALKFGHVRQEYLDFLDNLLQDVGKTLNELDLASGWSDYSTHTCPVAAALGALGVSVRASELEFHCYLNIKGIDLETYGMALRVINRMSKVTFVLMLLWQHLRTAAGAAT